MGYVAGQAFLEAPDGETTIFTALQQFEPGTLQAFQGSLALAPGAYIELSYTQVRSLDPDTQQTWTIDATANTLYCEAHGLSQNAEIVVWSAETDGLPEGLVRSAIYFAIVSDEDRIQLAALEDGDAVTFGATASGTLSLGVPAAPIAANGTWWYNAVTLGETVDPDLVVGFWMITDWQTQYARLTALATIRDILTDAQERVEAYVTEASYVLAEAEEKPYYRLFRRVIGELAFFYLMRRPGGLQQIKASTKQYGDNTKKYSQQYDTSVSQLLKSSESDILAQLITYKRESSDAEDLATSPGALTRYWGTNRYYGLLDPEDTTY